MMCHRLLAGAVSVLLAGVPVVLTGSTQAAAAVGGDPASPATWAHDLGCTLLEPVRTRYLWANGTEVSPAAPPEVKQLAALELTYRLPNGMTSTSLQEPYITGPPEVPLDVLRSFGYDARQAAYRNYGNTVTAMQCVSRTWVGSTMVERRR